MATTYNPGTSSTSTTTTGSSQVGNGSQNAPMTDRASTAAHSAVDSIASKAATAEEKIRQTASNSQNTFHQKEEEIKQQLSQSLDRTRQMTQQNPLATIGIAFAAGMLFSSLLRRSR